jgi:adenosylcobinamide kinase/adenosylcobinamide-phosphate guanylyltransferase
MPQGKRSRITLVLGGARSGKSAFAVRLAERGRAPVLFLATATASDAEMEERIALHRAARPPEWRTLEAPLEIGRAVRAQLADARTILLDCLSLLVSNVMLACKDDGERPEPTVEARVASDIRDLVALVREVGADLIVVSNEVGMSVVPASPLGRSFRDALGRANQEVAGLADAVYLVVAGIPVDVKRLAASLSRERGPRSTSTLPRARREGS